MSTTPSAAAATSQAFDHEAPGYAERWDSSPLVRFWRARVLLAALGATPAGGRIVDLGLGTGTDARCLAAAGASVVGIDLSPGMVALAQARGVRAHLGDLLDAPARLGGGFDTALCNFGVLNCLPSLTGLCATLGALLRPGGCAVLVWMSPHCPADTVSRLLRAQRPRRGRAEAVVSGVAVPLRWWSAAEVATALRPGFSIRRIEAIGLLDPPPDLGGTLGIRTRIEPYLARLPGLRELGDHTLLVAERGA